MKIDTKLHTDHPCNATELCMFIGCISYYCDMWPSRAHILRSLCLVIYGRVSLAMEGKSVVPMEITYMDMEDENKKYGTLSPLRYVYLNPFRFLISSLGSANVPSREG